MMLFIENKLDADEQVNQSQSYAEEARFVVASQRAARAWSLLVCPRSYAAQKAEFAAGF